MSKDFPGRSKARHGTDAGFQAHKRYGSVVCADCREAHNKACRELMRKIYDPAKRRARYLASKQAAARG